MRIVIISFLLIASVVVFWPQAGGAVVTNDDENTNMTALKTAIFAGGCFWCMESDFESFDGIPDVQSGYAGGHVENPAYKAVSQGGTGHREVIQVTYNPAVIGYEKLLEIFWRNIDPFDDGGQFCDKGYQYTAAVFASNDEERTLAESSKAALEKRFGRAIVTEIVPVATFYPAEDYHQNYYKMHSWRYKYYRGRCGRDERLQEIWGNEAGGGATH